MLRDAEDAPAPSAQFSVHCPVALPIPSYLGFPELFVPLWGSVALWTSVPEAAINEDRQPLLAEGEVGFPGELQMPPPSRDPLLTEELHEHPLRPLIPSPLDPRHHLGSLLLGEDVWHVT